MKPTTRPILTALAGVAFACTTGCPVSAETYPSRPITIVVPFAAGSGIDSLARILAEPLRTSLGQPVVVENVTGAGGTIAVARVARAAPDGYTLSLGDQTSHVSSPAMFPVQFDVLSDLAPVIILPTSPQAFLGRSTMKAKDLAALVTWLRENPDRTSLALPGTFGSGGHLSGLEFQHLTSTKLAFVPYQRGGAQAIQDLVAGHVDLLFVDASTALPYIRGGQVKAYGVASTHRWAAAPDIPTLAEASVPLYFSLWRAIWAPKATSKEIIAKINVAVADALADPAIRERVAALGQEIQPREEQTPAALAAFHRAQTEKWWPVIKAANIRSQ